jgi:hypothetical protein
MSKFTFKNASIYNHCYDHSATLNNIELKAEIANKDATAFGSAGWQANYPGMIAVDVHEEGFLDLAESGNDNYLFSKVGTTGAPLSVYGEGSALTKVGYGFVALESKYNPVLNIGDMAAFRVDAKGSGTALVRITSMNTPAAVSSTANGTSVQLGTVSATQSLHSFLHVYAASGLSPTLTMSVSSSTSAGGSYTTRLTHTVMNTLGSEYKSAVGPITDTFYRVRWAVTGTNPSFTFAIGVGIQ